MMALFTTLLIIITLTCLAATNAQSTAPQQIHLAYGDSPSIMTVTWATAGDAISSVNYGVQQGALTQQAQADSIIFTLGNPNGLPHIHRASMTSLAPATRYYYQLTSDNSTSEIYTFMTMSLDPNWSPVFLVYGDMGRDGGSISLPLLEKEVAAGGIAGIIHVGDFAYDLDTNGGITGDQFMQRIQPMASTVPYMTCIGNHELAYNLSHYTNRFYMPNQKAKNMWYSFNAGLIHFISYSSEVFFDTNAKLQDMLDWLAVDLAAANSPAGRAAQPWIVAFGHRPMYCSNVDGDDCTTEKSIVRAGLEEVFYKGGIDLIIQAHEHSYERLWPVWNETVTQNDYNNPQAPVHLVAGSAGCNEQSGICVNPIFGPKGPWSAFSAWFLAYGYGHLQAINHTHLYWDQILDITGGKLDSFYIVQTQHGPFPHTNITQQY